MTEKPSVIFIVMDSARADRFSAYGYGRDTTPCLSALAERGLLFEQAISAAAWTIPSHATFFTGLYPSEHRCQHHRIQDDVGPLMAEVLRAAGYQTIAVVNNTLLHPDSGLTRGFDEYVSIGEQPERMRGPKLGRHFARGMGWRDSGAWLTNRTVFERLGRARRPFFLFVNYMETHFPFLPPPALRRRFIRRRRHSWQRFPLALRFMKGRYWALLTRRDPAVFSLLSDLYDGELAYLDSRIGELVDWLDSKRLSENAILVIASDHGENLGDHGLLTHHFCLYDSLIRIPLIVLWPGRLPEGERVQDVVSSADLMPSLCRALGLEFWSPPRPGPARPMLLEPRRECAPGLESFSEYHPPFYVKEWARSNPEIDLATYAHQLSAIRTDRFKYIEGSDGRQEFYDLASDAQEVNNLAGEKTADRDSLAAGLSRWREAVGSRPGFEPTDEDPELLERLRSLGYI
jgi:arylsulfatase A-like enzyme